MGTLGIRRSQQGRSGVEMSTSLFAMKQKRVRKWGTMKSDPESPKMINETHRGQTLSVNFPHRACSQIKNCFEQVNHTANL